MIQHSGTCSIAGRLVAAGRLELGKLTANARLLRSWRGRWEDSGTPYLRRRGIACTLARTGISTGRRIAVD